MGRIFNLLAIECRLVHDAATASLRRVYARKAFVFIFLEEVKSRHGVEKEQQIVCFARYGNNDEIFRWESPVVPKEKGF